MLSSRTKRHRRRELEPARAFERTRRKLSQPRNVERLGRDVAFRQKAAQSFLRRSSRYLVSGLSGGGPIERRLRDLFVADRNVEARAELAQLLLVQLLLLMRDVAAFAGFAEAIAFDGFGENDRGLALVFHRGFVSGINFRRIVAAAHQLAQSARRSDDSPVSSSSGYLPKKCLRM